MTGGGTCYHTPPPHITLRPGFIIDSLDVGGSELNAVKLAEALSRAGIKLTVFHFQPTGSLRDRYDAIGAELIHVPLRGFVSASAYQAVRRIRRESTARQLQLLHTHCAYSNILGAAVRRSGLRRLPLLASRRWTGYAVRPGLHPLNAVAQSVADAVLVNTPSLLRVVSGESRWSKPVYIPNMLPDASFREVGDEEKRQKRRALSIPADGPIVGCVARLAPVKDHKTLLTAWQRVVQRIPSAVLVFVGGGELAPTLSAQAAELGIGSSVHLVGEVTPASLPHSLLDISALSSLDEGFPNSLLEAMAQRIPVVSTNVGGVPDLVTHEQNGLLVPKGNANAMADALIRLLTEPETVRRLVEGGVQTALSHQEGPVLTALLQLYRDVISR